MTLRMFLKYQLILVLSTLFLNGPALAEDYDGLELVQAAGRAKLEKDTRIDFAILKNSTGETRIAAFFSLSEGQARLYLDLASWRSWQEMVARAATTEPPERERVPLGTIDGLRVGPSDTNLRLEVLGETRLGNRQLLMMVLCKGPKQFRHPISLDDAQQTELLERMHTVDTFMAP
ncbi:MAG: hypothetical protein KC910_18345 [Candidatus Eremiobacteraeota bacterium]|nr:hypothetical protein [Candidatus Eremiobacteraeota bacterium]